MKKLGVRRRSLDLGNWGGRRRRPSSSSFDEEILELTHVSSDLTEDGVQAIEDVRLEDDVDEVDGDDEFDSSSG